MAAGDNDYANSMNHPFGMLLIKDGQLFRRVTKNYVTTETNTIPYMNIADVEIQDKLHANPAAHPAGYWDYLFELNTNPDPIWKELFYKNIGLNRDAAPDFTSDLMTLRCDPANLKSLYQDIKAAIGKTNVAYKAEKEKVIAGVEQAMARQGLEQTRRTGEEEKIRSAFDELEL
jgi:hypothetical protein